MKLEDIKTICVIGAGNMGHQISLNAAIHGYQTICIDTSGEALDKARAFVEKYLPERVTKGKMTPEVAEAAKNNISFSTNLVDSIKNADFIIEAATEKLQLKRKIFAELDKYAPPHAILATNSSFIVSSKVADVTRRPNKVCNMHFFNPALAMKVVEVVQGPHTSVETVQVTIELCRKLGKNPVFIRKEIYGFVVNRILNALNQEAFWLASEGYASPEDIDIAIEGGLNHPMGPFRLVDLTGIDLAYDIYSERYQETGDPKDAPSPIIIERYQAGEYGRKTGKGFYKY